MNNAEVLSALELQEKLSALQLLQAKLHFSENTAGDSDCSSAFDRSNGVIEGIPTYCSTVAVELCYGICSGCGAIFTRNI